MAASDDFSDEFQPLSSEFDEATSNQSEDISEGDFSADCTTSKNGILWKINKPSSAKISKENIMYPRPGPTTYCIQKVKHLLDYFFIFFLEEICYEIIKHTNSHGKLILKDSWNDLDLVELKGFFGALILMAVYKDREQPLIEMFSLKEGREVYRTIFSYNCFRQILRCIHFDDPNTRSARRELDKFCPIRDIWSMWVETLHLCFWPKEDVTLDEQLVPFKGRCTFRQYMPMKPAKYGLKFFLAVDPVNKYKINISPYLGKNGTQPNQSYSVGENIVLSLTAPLYNSGRTMVADNFFTSLRLAEKLLEKRLTYLGTIRHKKRELPRCVLPSKNRPLFCTVFTFFEKFMLTSYVNKKRKAVILLSSGTKNTNIAKDNNKLKPETIVNYNGSKGG